MKRIIEAVSNKRGFIARSALVIAVGVVVYFLVSISQSNSERGKQIEAISKENRQLNQQNLAYMRCLATVFATYTQNGVPVTIENLDTCTVRQADGTTVPVTSLPSESGGSSVTVSNEPPDFQALNNDNPTPQEEMRQDPPDNPPPPTQEPIRVLGVPLCVPDPLGLIDNGVCVKNE